MNIIWTATPLHVLVDSIAEYSTETNTIHILKTVAPHFSEVWNEFKTAELRDSSDRNFKCGDILVLREWIRYEGKYVWGQHGVICGITNIVGPEEIKTIFGETSITVPMCMLSFELLEKFKLKNLNTTLIFP